MREILFKGKMVDGKGWVEGYYIGALTNDFRSVICNISDGKIYAIHPETVGQYTGLVDKNREKIFEGDVIKHQLASEPEHMGFKVDFINLKWCCVNVFDNHIISMCTHADYWETCEIIGNIHDK